MRILISNHTRAASLAIVATLVAVSTQVRSAPTQTVTHDESSQIIAQLRKKHAPFFVDYKGVRSVRDAQVKIVRDGQTENRRLRVQRTAYFYRPPQESIVAAWRNGAPVPPEQVKPERNPGAPPFPVFDKDSAANYRPQVQSITTCSGRTCYVIQIRPTRRSARHLVGTLYVDQKSLQILRFVGSLSQFPTGVKSMRLDIQYGQQAEHSVVISGTIRVKAYIPLLVPESTMITTFRESGHEPFR